MRNGELCRRCGGGQCSEGIDEGNYVELECPACGGIGCEYCTGGFFHLTECSRSYVDAAMVQAINMAAMADKHLPAAGGLLDQSAWFVRLMTELGNEQNKIDAERIERAKNGQRY